ncbi:MAG: MotA/TolQ/ExbB proton channel family protein [uncultured Sulfurovum sp.]|uniref:MotA/TolQ/ExbB proton channel family protein n=1 Tax=uncultured Sulfurovum sp. TaxID=269237 RepID=A0A6S6TQR0_9BACT|nr:MAG: MotA/TolQ/ExbB proton channel family protein [uncultured Sulfurovum sp.]
MELFESLFAYLGKSSAITIFVLAILSIYLFIVLWIYIYRYFSLKFKISTEAYSLKKLYMGRSKTVEKNSLLYPFLAKVLIPNQAIFSVAKNDAIKSATGGLTALSIIASTSPFIGLFGTVVAILETFSKLGTQTGTSIAIVAPAISEALVATAAGIAVATFAYSFHLILKRKSYELSVLLESQADLILSQKA